MCILIFHLSDPRMAWMSEHLASTNEWQRAIRSKRSSSVCGRLRRSSAGCRRWTSDRGSWRTGASPWRRLWEGRGQVRAFCTSLIICQPGGGGWGGFIRSVLLYHLISCKGHVEAKLKPSSCLSESWFSVCITHHFMFKEDGWTIIKLNELEGQKLENWASFQAGCEAAFWPPSGLWRGALW